MEERILKGNVKSKIPIIYVTDIQYSNITVNATFSKSTLEKYDTYFKHP